MQRKTFVLVFICFFIIIVFAAREAKAQDDASQVGAAADAEQRMPANAGAEFLMGYITAIPPEAAEHREARHKKIAERRAGPVVIVHRAAWAFAPENTLAAYAAAMDYGADGCEMDIRRTADGVLVMLHDRQRSGL